MGTKKKPAGTRGRKRRTRGATTEDDPPMPGWNDVPKVAREAITFIWKLIQREQQKGWEYEKDKGK